MSKVEQRPVIGIVPTQVPDEDIVRVYGPDGLVEAIEVRDPFHGSVKGALPRGAPSREGLAYREARRWREMAEHSFCRLYLTFS